MDLSIPRGEEERPAEEVFKEAPEDARVRGHVAFRSVPPYRSLVLPDLASLALRRRYLSLAASLGLVAQAETKACAYLLFPSCLPSPAFLRFGGPPPLVVPPPSVAFHVDG